MVMRGWTISLYLINGYVTGAIKCTLPNWTGVIYKIPRTELEACKTREDLKQSGVYFLFGKSDETGESVVYVGQAGLRKTVMVCSAESWNTPAIQKRIIGQKQLPSPLQIIPSVRPRSDIWKINLHS